MCVCVCICVYLLRFEIFVAPTTFKVMYGRHERMRGARKFVIIIIIVVVVQKNVHEDSIQDVRGGKNVFLMSKEFTFKGYVTRTVHDSILVKSFVNFRLVFRH